MIQMIRELDLGILEWIATHLHGRVLDALMPVITLFGESGFIWIAVALAMLCFKKTRRTGMMLCLALLIGYLIGNRIMKPTFGRLRPYDYIADYLGDASIRDNLLVSALRDFSFPSGHTLVSFEAAGVLLARHRKPWGFLALGLAFLVAFSRLYLYVHYPTDVLAGAILGILFGVCAVWIVNLLCDRFHLFPDKKVE